MGWQFPALCVMRQKLTKGASIVYRQVCVVKTVRVSGYRTNIVTFANNGTAEQFVKVEVRWDNGAGTRIFGRNIPAGKEIGSGKNKRYKPGILTEPVPGIIDYINECP